MPNANVNGIDVNYERSGSGKRLLYLNGSGATLATSQLVIAPFIQGFEVLAHDQRGLGLTSIPPGPYTMAEYAADAVGLLDHVGWDTCRVVGISFGGMVALELAATVPERVERLGLLCTSAGGAGGASYPLHDMATLEPAERARLAPLILDTRFTPDWLATHDSDRGLAEMMAARQQGERSEDVQRGEAEQLAARKGHDVWERISKIDCPTLVAAGRYDGIAPLPNSKAIASRIPDAELKIYEGGHAFFAQDPAAFPDVIAFLDAG